MGKDELARLFNRLTRFEAELWNAVDRRLRAEHGLALNRFEPMQVIGQRVRCRVFDISSELSLTIGGTSKLVDRLEEAGLCRRLPNPDDGRSSLIELTEDGETLRARAEESVADELSNRLALALPEDAVVRLGTVLDEVRLAGYQSAGIRLAD